LKEKKMRKSYLFVLSSLGLITVLAACSIFPKNTTNASSPNGATTNGSQPERFSDPAKMPLEQKLAIGTLKLEGTPQAITTDQAAALLPLWQALKSLSTSENTAEEEIKALYTQIEEAMTPEQVKAIQDLTWTQDDMTALREKYGNQGGGDFAGQPTMSADQRATRQAQFSANGGGNNGGGGGPAGGPPDGGGGGGFPPDGGGGNFQGDGQGRTQGTPQAARTPSAAQLNRQAMGFNSIFADGVIKLLEERAKS
jgi:hypothetical protein